MMMHTEAKVCFYGSPVPPRTTLPAAPVPPPGLFFFSAHLVINHRSLFNHGTDILLSAFHSMHFSVFSVSPW